MARIRTIKPEFWQNESLANCSAHARLLAIALLQLADSKGRFRWIPMQVHAHAFPFEPDVDLMALAEELVKIGYINLYDYEGKRYAEIPKFLKHQRLTGKEAAGESKIPSGETTGISPVFPEEAPRCPGTREQGNKGTRERNSEDKSSGAGAPREIPSEENPPAGEINIWSIWTSIAGEKSRSLLGKLIRDYGEESVANAVAVTSAKRPADPVAFIRGVLRDGKTTEPKTEDLSEFTDPDSPPPPGTLPAGYASTFNPNLGHWMPYKQGRTAV